MENQNQVQKPGGMIIKETKSKIIEVLNNSGLHIGVIQLLMQDLLNQTNTNADIISRQEEENYYRQLEEQEKRKAELSKPLPSPEQVAQELKDPKQIPGNK